LGVSGSVFEGLDLGAGDALGTEGVDIEWHPARARSLCEDVHTHPPDTRRLPERDGGLGLL
jgi:hypothetical protein